MAAGVGHASLARVYAVVDAAVSSFESLWLVFGHDAMIAWRGVPILRPQSQICDRRLDAMSRFGVRYVLDGEAP